MSYRFVENTGLTQLQIIFIGCSSRGLNNLGGTWSREKGTNLLLFRAVSRDSEWAVEKFIPF